MAATALIKFTQGITIGGDGEALVGVVADGGVTVENSNNTDVSEWIIELLYAPPGSALETPPGIPIVLATSVSPTPSAAFVPDIDGGCYRIRLTVMDALGAPDVDIRCFGTPLPSQGIIPPPYQRWPDPLPLEGVGAKPDEMNFGGQPYGWAGGDAPGPVLLHQVLKLVDAGGGGGLTPPTTPAQDNFLVFANAGDLGYSADWTVWDGTGEIEGTAGVSTISNWGGDFLVRAGFDLTLAGDSNTFVDAGTSGGWLRTSASASALKWDASLLRPYKRIAFDSSVGYTWIGFDPQTAAVGAPYFGIPSGIQLLAQHAGSGGGDGAESGIQAGNGDIAGGAFGGNAWIRPGAGAVGKSGESQLRNSSGTPRVRAGGALDGVGFHNTAPIAKPTITGSRAGNAALASLLTALANYGLITDSTTA